MRIVVLTAPSGSGKTTIAHRLMDAVPSMQFSVSATTREPREGEVHGADYFFLSVNQFRELVDAGAFVEWEEVYSGIFYGTLHNEIERIAQEGTALLDIDVKGALNVKRHYAERALTLFIRPPSLDILAERLRTRGTETEEQITFRLERVRLELDHAHHFDHIILNDDLETAVTETVSLVRHFLAIPE